MSTDPRCSFNTNYIVLKRNTSEKLKFPIGFTSFDIDNRENLRVRAEVQAVPDDPTSYKVVIPSWWDTRRHCASCNWLEVYDNDRDFQFGQFNTNDSLISTKRCPVVSQYIAFPKKFNSQPTVVIWLNLLDFDKAANLRVNAWASDATPIGFQLHIDTWADTIMMAARVSWIAYPTNRINIRSGKLSMRGGVGSEPHQLTFDPPFIGPGVPHVVAAFSMLDIGNQANATTAVKVHDVNEKGMSWTMGCWGETRFYGGDAMYIAFQDL